MPFFFDPQELSGFARLYGFHYDAWDPPDLVQDILRDMERGLAGQSSSLPMIPSYIHPGSHVPAGKTVLALDAGGTNLRASLVRFDENGGKAVAEGTVKAPMPGTRGRVTAEEFFDGIAGLALPLLERGGRLEGIGFTFSYSMDITGEADGILLSFSKEVDAPEVIGKSIGQGLREALSRRGFHYQGRIVLVNDTAAALLSGLVEISENGEGGAGRTKDAAGLAGGPVIGLILGTGFNTAYPEKRIPKIGFESAENPQIVVCETGAFALPHRGALDREYDRTTKTPGAYTLEKTCAGAYLGPLTLQILKQAVKDRVLCFHKSEELLNMPFLHTRELNEFMRAPLAGPLGGLFGPGERDARAAVQYLVEIITERAGLVGAAAVAAAVERIDAPPDPLAPVRIAVEGTTYLVFKGMRRALESRLHTMLVSGKLRPYVIAPVEQASLFGAAVAALSE
jgi:hexokinase